MISTYKGLNRLFIAGSIAGIALLYAFPLIAKTTENPTFYLQVVSVAAFSAILTISLNICMGYGGLLSLMHTGMQMMGGYALGILMVKKGWNGWLASSCYVSRRWFHFCDISNSAFLARHLSLLRHDHARDQLNCDGSDAPRRRTNRWL